MRDGEHVMAVNPIEHERLDKRVPESPDLSASIIGSAMDAIIAVDDARRIVLFNAAAEKMFRCPADEAMGNSVEHFIPQRFRAGHSTRIHQFDKSGVTNRTLGHLGTLSGLRATGEEFPIEASISKVESGGKKFFTAVIRDITERKLAEDKLREYENAVEGLEEMIVVVDREYRYLIANRKFLDRRDMAREQVEGHFANEVMNKGVFEAVVKEKLDECFQGNVVRFEMKYTYPELGERDISVSYFPIEGANGVDRVACIVQDITERRRAEDTITENEKRYRRIVETANEGVWLLDSGLQNSYVNQQMAEMLGYEPGEMVGRSVLDFYFPEDVEQKKQVLTRRQQGRREQIDERLRRKDGSELWVRIAAAPVFKDNGEFDGALAMVSDITQRRRAEEILRESEERLRLSAQAGRMYAFEWDVTTDVLVRSSEYVNVLGATEPRALTHQQAMERIHPDDRPKLVAAVARHSPENPTVDVTYRVLLPDKTPVWVKSSGRAFFDREGRMLRVIGMVADITDQKLAEEALCSSEERLRLAQKVARIGSFERNIRTGVNTWTAEMESMYGLPPGGFGQTRTAFENLVHPDDRAEVITLVDGALRTGQPTEGEWRVVWGDGSVHWIAGRWQVLMNESGEPSRVVGVNLDITERKLAEEALHESEERFRLVANTAPVMIWVSGLDKKPTYFNQLWLDFTGLSQTDLLNGLAGIVHPEDYPRGLDVYCRAFDQRQPFRKECRLRRHDGQYRWILDIGVPRFHTDGSFAGYIGSCIDVTDQKIAEEAVSDMTRKLVEAQEQERARIARELHDDINQRLAMLAVELEQVRKNNVDLPSEVLRTMQELQKQTTDISNDVQAISHDLHSSQMEYLGVVAGMKGWCKEFGERQRMEIDCRHDVRSTLPPEIGLCLFRVLQEALHNAAKHSGVKRIEVQLQEQSGEIHLSVRDLGKGFDVEAARQGKGLGLTSMRERARLVNGTISIESKPMAGTNIHVCVPIRSEGFSERAVG